MSINFASWNVESRLSADNFDRRGSPTKIVDEIEALDADVVVLIEAFDGLVGVSPAIESRLTDLGYEHIVDTPYDDRGGPERPYPAAGEPNSRILSKLAIQESQIIRPGDLRNMRRFVVTDPASGELVTMYAVHFDDRSPALRLAQFSELPAILKEHPGHTLVAGDFNTSTGVRAIPRLFNTPIVKATFSRWPGVMGYVGRNASQMVSGEELHVFEDLTGLTNADESGELTTTPKLKSMPFWIPAIPMLDIDHMYYSPDVILTDFKVMKRDGGPDHRSISATLSVASPR